MRTTRWPDGPSTRDWSDRVRVRGALLQAAWVDFLGRLPWELFVTLTFDPSRVYPVGRVRASREAFRWCGHVAWTLRHELAWLIAVERGRSGQWHAHALLAGVEHDISAVAAIWRMRNGQVDVRAVHDTQRIVLYSTKQAALSGEIVLSDSVGLYRDRLGIAPRVLLHPEFPMASTRSVNAVGNRCPDDR